MDTKERARALLDAVAQGGDVEAFLHDGLSFRTDAGDILDRDGLLERLRSRRGGGHGHRYVFGEAVTKRNIVFASWQWQAPDGSVKDSGTWFLSFDREGLVTDWAEIVAGAA